MQRSKLCRLGVLIAAPAMMGFIGVSAAQAAYPYDMMTFDNAGSITNNEDNSGDAGTWWKNFNPPPANVRLAWSQGNPGGMGNHVVAWSTTDHTGNGGGSVGLTMNFAGSQTGIGEDASYSFDLTSAPVYATNISFYLMLDPNSAVDSNPADMYGNGAPDASSGYAQMFIDDSSGAAVAVGNVSVNGNNVGGGWNLGDPSYSGTSDRGTWEYISIPLTGSNSMIKGMLIQDYVDNSASGRVVNGPVTMYIDDLTVTAPEPASLAIFAMGLPALLMRRRRGI